MNKTSPTKNEKMHILKDNESLIFTGKQLKEWRDKIYQQATADLNKKIKKLKRYKIQSFNGLVDVIKLEELKQMLVEKK